MTRGRVLFIDDEVELCRAAQEWLGVSGFSVTTSSNPETAIAQTDPDTLDCVVSDVRMPRCSGVELLKNVRLVNPELPIVLLATGFADLSEPEALSMGAYGLIEKPINRKRMVAMLEDYCLSLESLIQPKTAGHA